MTTAPTSPEPAIRKRPARVRKRLFWPLFLLAATSVGIWGVLHSPILEEQRLAHRSLPALIREMGGNIDRVNDPRLLYYVGLRLNQQERFQEADPVLRRGVGLSPDDPRLRDEWARALLGSGLTTAAFGELREFAGTHPHLAQAHLLLGKFYFLQRSMQRASEEFDEAIRQDPRFGEAWSYLASAQQDLGNAERARDAARRAVALRPDNAGDHLVYATLLTQANQPEKAREEYARAARLGPRLANAHREYARWLTEFGKGEGDLRLAEAEAQRALGLEPKDAVAHLALGTARLQQGRFQEALDPLLQAASLAPDNPLSASLLAQLYRKLGREGDAARWQRSFVQRQHDASERAKVFEALRANPDSAELHTRMAHLLGKQGDVAGCVHSHAMALKCAVDAPPALIAAANDLTDAGYAADALPMARRAVMISAANPAAHEALGNALLALGQAHLAGLEYNKTVSWWPRRAPLLEKRLEKYYRERAAHPPPSELAYREARRLEHQNFGPKRMTPEVEAMAKKAVSLEPTNPNYLWYLFGVQMAQRENDAAIQTANQMLALTPKDARTHALLSLLLVEKATGPEDFAAVEAHLKAAEPDPSSAPTRHYVSGLLALRRRQGPLAVQELRQAASLDPYADVTFFKLAQAEEMVGDRSAADAAMAEFRKREAVKRSEAEALSDIGQHRDQPETYAKAAALFDSHGLNAQADAIRAEAHRRFASRASAAGATISSRSGE